MCYIVYRIIVCSRTKIRMISSLRNLCVRILDADQFTIVVFQILDIKSNYLPGIVQVAPWCPSFRPHSERQSGYCVQGGCIHKFKIGSPLESYCLILHEPSVCLCLYTNLERLKRIFKY
jgi:hypothetical protein